jgi:hypothetical protein
MEPEKCAEQFIRKAKKDLPEGTEFDLMFYGEEERICEDNPDYWYLTVSVPCNVDMVEDAESFVLTVAKEHGLFEAFVQSGAGFGGNYRDVTFIQRGVV